MSATLPLLAGAFGGVLAASALLPLTRRSLSGALVRAGASGHDPLDTTMPTLEWLPRTVLIAVSGILPAYVLSRVGWSAVALPPLFLLIGLIQLAYCDVTRKLLPKTMVHGLSLVLVLSGVLVAWTMHEWDRLLVAAIGGGVLYTLLLVMNLMNPRWIAFGDVRLSFAVGFGLAWISPVALLEGFFLANALAAVTGLALMGLRRTGRGAVVPFGLYLAIGAALVLLTWS